MGKNKANNKARKAARVRHRPPRKKPLQPMSSASRDALFERARPQIEHLLPEAATKLDHAIFVVDPKSPMMQGMSPEASAKWAPLAELAGNGLLVALMPITTIARLARIWKDEPGGARMMSLLEAPPTPGQVRVVVQGGWSFELCAVALPSVEADVVNEGADDEDEPKIRALLEAARPAIAKLVPEAMHKRDHFFFVMDPASPLARDDADDPADQTLDVIKELDKMGDEPIVVLLPSSSFASLTSILNDSAPTTLGANVAELYAQASKPPAENEIRILACAGRTFAIAVWGVHMSARQGTLALDLDQISLIPGLEVVERGEGYALSPMGALKVLLASELDEISDEGKRETIRRLQERARGALAAEAIRVAPRDTDAVLSATFNVPEMRRIIAERGFDAGLDFIFGQATRVS